jgi:hypothetical protein
MIANLLTALFLMYILPTILCIFVGSRNNRKMGYEDLPLTICFIPGFNIVFAIGVGAELIFQGKMPQKFKNWYIGIKDE